MNVASNMGERMAAVETKLDIVIDTQKAMNEKLDKVLPTYVTKSDFDDAINGLNRRRWMQNTLSAILGVLLTLLTTYAFTDLIK